MQRKMRQAELRCAESRTEADIEQKAERQVSEGLRTVLEHLAAYVDKVHCQGTGMETTVGQKERCSCNGKRKASKQTNHSVHLEQRSSHGGPAHLLAPWSS